MKRSRVSFTIEFGAPWARELELWFREFVEDGPALRFVLARVLTQGVLVALRKRFLSRVSQAQMLQFRSAAARSDMNVARLAAKRTALLKAQRAQASAMERGSAAGLERAQDRIDQILQEMQSKQSESQATNAAGYSKQLTRAAIGSGLFRQRQAQVLYLLTQEPQLVQGSNGLMAGAGRLSELDEIKTPSATRWLKKVETRSKLNVFWRHLEFGTGEFAKTDTTHNPYTPGSGRRVVISSAAAKAQKRAGGASVSWYYGALGIRGSSFMSFLYTDIGGRPLQTYTDAAQQALEQAMEEVLPKLTT